MGKIHWISVDGSITVEESSKNPSLKKMQEYVGGYIEHISVLYKGKPATMYANEEGATNWHPGYPLPVNKPATDIYHAFTLSRGLPAPVAKIHGAAIVLEGIPMNAPEQEEEGGEDEAATED